jgi:hypothetical protein
MFAESGGREYCCLGRSEPEGALRWAATLENARCSFKPTTTKGILWAVRRE